MGKTSYNKSWEDRSDQNGNRLQLWLRPGNSSEFAFCSICNKGFRIDSSGFSQVTRHASGLGHIQNAKLLHSKGQKKIGEIFNTPSVQKTNPVLKSEILWALNTCSKNFSFRDSRNCGNLFKTMFPDSKIASEFTMDSTKLSYVVSYGLGPYFIKQTASLLQNNFYCLEVDETTSLSVLKQLDIYARVFNPETQQVDVHYLQSKLLGHATAEILKDAILNTLSELKIPLQRMLCLSSDGPNVCKKLFRLLDLEVSTKLGSLHDFGLLNIGTCNLHVIHNTFSIGLQSVEWNIEELLIDVYYFFHKSPARREDFKSMEMFEEFVGHCSELPFKHCASRWLSIVPALERLCKIMPALKHYFFNVLASRPCSEKDSRYKRICNFLKHPLLSARIEFIKFLSVSFQSFLSAFQAKSCLIHKLWKELRSIFVVILQKCTTLAVSSLSGSELASIQLEDSSVWKKCSDLEIGTGALKVIISLHVNSADQKIFRYGFSPSVSVQLEKYI